MPKELSQVAVNNFGGYIRNGILLPLGSAQIIQLSDYFSSNIYDDFDYPSEFRGPIYNMVWLKKSLSSHDLEPLMQGLPENSIRSKTVMICLI